MLRQEARDLHLEATALEAVLEYAPRPDQHRLGAISDRILAAALKTGPGPAPRFLSKDMMSNVIALPVRAAPATSRSLPQARTRLADGPGLWRAATSLAASLVVGIMIGTFELAPLSLTRFVESVEVDQDVELFVSALGGEGIAPAPDEDYL